MRRSFFSDEERKYMEQKHKYMEQKQESMRQQQVKRILTQEQLTRQRYRGGELHELAYARQLMTITKLLKDHGVLCGYFDHLQEIEYRDDFRPSLKFSLTIWPYELAEMFPNGTGI